MPTYSYRCTECENAFDIHQSFSDDTLTVCPVCGGKLRKIFSPVGVTFNGSGFYRTDSRAKSDSGAKPSSGAGGEGAGSGSTSSGDSKPASTAAPAAPAAKPSKPASTTGSTSAS